MDKEMWSIHTQEYYSAIKKKQEDMATHSSILA